MSPWRPTAACLFYFTFRGIASNTRSVSIYISVGISGGLQPIPSLLTLPANTLNVHWWINHDAFMHAFFTSYVRTVLRVLSKYSLACWFGQMLTKAISWMKSSIASPTSSGVPVSLLRSWSWSLFYNRFRQPPNKFIGSHSDIRWTVRYWSHVTHYTVTYPPPLLLRVSSYATLPLCHIRPYV